MANEKIKIISVLSSPVVLTGAQYLKSEKFNPFYENIGINLILPSKLKDQYAQLSNWEKIFVNSFYGTNKNGITIHKPLDKQTKYSEVREHIESELNKLYALADDDEYFAISTQDNQELEREYQAKINALNAKGEGGTAQNFENNKQNKLNELATKFAQSQQEEYKDIVDYIKNTSYESAFKVMMLRETLLKTYKQTNEDENGKTQIISKARIPQKTLQGYMTLNEDVLNTVYNNPDNYTSFKDLYFAGIAISNKTISEKSGIKIEGIETFNKGHWMKFEGKQSNKDAYIKNVQELSALVQDTPWCTKKLAASQLEQGDFFVFEDNDNKPHIAVKMNGNTIDEVRGIQNGNAQELEEDYREVALEFLTKNKDIKNGKEWLEKEEWNKRLIMWKQKIENNTFVEQDYEQCKKDILTQDYKAHFCSNSNRDNLMKVLPNDFCIKALGYDKNKISIGDYHANCWNQGFYIHILGNANFAFLEITDLGDLQSISKSANFREVRITSLGNLQSIGEDANFEYAQITDLGNLQHIGRHADFNGSKIKSLGNLQSIGGSAAFENSQIIDLGNLQYIGGDAYFGDSQITELGKLQSIGGIAKFIHSRITDLGNLQSIGGKADFSFSKITNLGKLQSIGGDANFYGSQIKSFGKLEHIGGEVCGLSKELNSKFFREFEKDKENGGYTRRKEFLPKPDKELGE